MPHHIDWMKGDSAKHEKAKKRLEDRLAHPHLKSSKYNFSELLLFGRPHGPDSDVWYMFPDMLKYIMFPDIYVKVYHVLLI